MPRSSWVPFNLSWNDAPIDLSFVYRDERPAGKHGFVQAVGGRLQFEDGTEARFWGTNLHGGANFPIHEESEQLARRLTKFGLNIVRLHQMDAEWSTPNIFASNRAEPQQDTQHLDAESMDRLDYLISCLKDAGIYCYLDMLTHRKFLPADGVEAEDQLPHGGSPYVYLDPRMIELQMAFNERLWGHLNPYTGLAYKDDPAIAMAELVNESDLFRKPLVVEPYRSRAEAAHREWAGKRGVSVAEGPIDFQDPDPNLAAFFVEVQEDFYSRLIDHLRGLGVRIPIAGTNWQSTLGHLSSQLVGDFVDNHVYWNFPHWDDVEGTVQTPMVKETWGSPRTRPSVFHRTLDKPFFLSEWNQCWPDEWRAESPIAYAAISAFQGWSGTTICGYRYSTYGPVDRLGGGATTIDGRTYRNLLNVFNDPALFGLFYHACLLFRRGDVRRGNSLAVVAVDDDETGAWRLMRESDLPAVELLAEKHVAGVSLPGWPIEADIVLRPDEAPPELASGSVRSDTGQLGRDWRTGFGWVDTPRTKAAYGFLGKAGTIELDGLGLSIETDFATVALSSLTDDPIERSSSMLLTAVGRCDNRGARYDTSHRWQLDPGAAPIMIEVIEGEIAIRTREERLKVWAIGERGEALARMPATEGGGILRFRIGLLPNLNPWGLAAFQWKPEASMYYLIRR